MHLAVLSIIAAVAELATFAALAVFLARIGRGDVALALPAALFAVAALASGAIRLWLAARTAHLTADVSHDLGVEVQRRLLHQPLAFHTGFHSAGALAAIDKVQLLSGGVLRPLVAVAQGVVIGGGILAALVVTTPLPGLLVIAVLGAFYVIIAKLSWRRIAAAQPVLGQAYEARTRTVQESFAGIRDVILDHLQEARTDAFRAEDGRLQRTMASLQAHASAPRFLIEGLGMALLGLLVLLLAGRGLAGLLPSLGLIAFAGLRLLPLAGSAYGSWQSWIAHRQVIDDVGVLLALPVADADVPAPLPFSTEVALVDVIFAYPGGPIVLDEVSMSIARGERVGIAGVTGAGKSTIGDLFMGFSSPKEGKLMVDGHPVSGRDIERWQRNVAHVGQQLFLLDASLADNIAFGDPRPDRQRILDALARACLGELEDRIDEPVGERGVRLSGGQRQRLGLARAIYKKAPFLVLDEATNALDEATEARVLEQFGREQTILMISHRPAALATCDRIVDLVDGKIVPRG